MIARPFAVRKPSFKAAGLALGLGLLLAACETVPTVQTTGPSIDPSAPVPVALLIPSGSEQPSDVFLAQNFENAARLAVGDLQGVTIDLRVYDTAADPTTAAAAAIEAVNDGARIIVGPLYAENANAAGLAVATRGVNVLTFSNNTAIAGGNVFLLGSTFANTAERLTNFVVDAEGLTDFAIVYGDDLQGAVARDAIALAAQTAGGVVVSTETYELTQEAIFETAGTMAEGIEASGADAVFLTSGVSDELASIATALPEGGISPDDYRYLGLTRWDLGPQYLGLPGAQGALIAVPDPDVAAAFEARYLAAYETAPHPLAGLAYDGIAAIGALVRSGDPQALSQTALTQPSGFQGTSGIFRLRADGTSERGLAIAEIQNAQVVVLEPAPISFAVTGF